MTDRRQGDSGTQFTLPAGGIYAFAHSWGVPMFPSGHSSSHNANDFVAMPYTLPDGTNTIALHCVDCLAPVAVIEQRVACRLFGLAEELELDLFARVDARPCIGDCKDPIVALWEHNGFDLKAYHPDMPWNQDRQPGERMIYLLAQHDPSELELLLDTDWSFSEGADFLWELQQNTGTPASILEVAVNSELPSVDAYMTSDGIRLDASPDADGRMRVAYGRGTEGLTPHYFRPVAYATRERFLDEGWIAFEVPPAPRPNPYFATPYTRTLGDRAGGLASRMYAREVVLKGDSPNNTTQSEDASDDQSTGGDR